MHCACRRVGQSRESDTPGGGAAELVAHAEAATHDKELYAASANGDKAPARRRQAIRELEVARALLHVRLE
jgi:hypothetical protein